jgi:hypothetical protein
MSQDKDFQWKIQYLAEKNGVLDRIVRSDNEDVLVTAAMLHDRFDTVGGHINDGSG